PMISGLEELRAAKAVFAECKEELHRSGVPMAEKIEVGAMIEIPSPAICDKPTAPAVLRLLKMIAEAAHANNIWVGVCGEMAGDVALIPLLLGLGIDELSASATLVPRVKRAVQSLAIPECRELVEETLKLNTASEILARCLELADQRYGDLLG